MLRYVYRLYYLWEHLNGSDIYLSKRVNASRCHWTMAFMSGR